jgi:hypothetical protein
VTLAVSPGELSVSEAEEIVEAADPAKAAGLEVETGGQLGQKVSKPATESSELIGIIAAMVILTLTFSTVVSMLSIEEAEFFKARDAAALGSGSATAVGAGAGHES